MFGFFMGLLREPHRRSRGQHLVHQIPNNLVLSTMLIPIIWLLPAAETGIKLNMDANKMSVVRMIQYVWIFSFMKNGDTF
jgi:hypothetical protein